MKIFTTILLSALLLGFSSCGATKAPKMERVPKFYGWNEAKQKFCRVVKKDGKKIRYCRKTNKGLIATPITDHDMITNYIILLRHSCKKW